MSMRFGISTIDSTRPRFIRCRKFDWIFDAMLQFLQNTPSRIQHKPVPFREAPNRSRSLLVREAPGPLRSDPSTEFEIAGCDNGGYLTSTFAPAASSFFLMSSASSLPMPSLIAFGAPSTRSLASFKPRAVISRTALMTLILFAPASARMTLNSVFSSTAAAGAAPGPAATATGAALTPHFVSSVLTSSAIWMTGRFERYSTTCSEEISAIFQLQRASPNKRQTRKGGTPSGLAKSKKRWFGFSDGDLAAVLALLGSQDTGELRGGRSEQTHERLHRRHERREQHAARFVLVGQSSQLIGDRLRAEHHAFEKTSFDLELLVLFLELLDRARCRARFFEAPRHARHSAQRGIEAGGPTVISQRFLHQLVLHDLVFHALGAEHVAKLADLTDGHAGEVEEDGRAHLAELGLEGLDGFRLLSAFHQDSSSDLATTVVGSTRKPRPMVDESVMLRR